jgi:hypothetical protein
MLAGDEPLQYMAFGTSLRCKVVDNVAEGMKLAGSTVGLCMGL